MSTEISMLLVSAGLYFIMILIPANEAVMRNGLALMTGPRDSLPEPSVFNARATRLRDNMAENMILFTVLVLAVEVTGRNNELTALASMIFVGARLAHAVVYLAGLPIVRPFLWGVWVVTYGMLVSQLV